MTAGLPVVAVVGRPNVGKSTLVNRIIGRREAIVEERPGVTRDRKILEAEWAGRPFTLVDTGGWMTGGDSLDDKVSAQAERAMREADLILFVVDASVGVTADDEAVAARLRRGGGQVLVVANKVDAENREPDVWDFVSLGLGDPVGVSALHGRSSGDLLDEVVARLPSSGASAEEPVEVTRAVGSVAIVGRPNVGKSTLFNRLIGAERSIVHDVPGTTRDSVDTVIETEDGPLRFVDTAGMRRKSRVDDGPEYFSLVRALQSIDRSDASLLVIDATEGVTHQDQRLAERVDAAGSPVVIILNKWELLPTEQREQVLADVGDRLAFLAYTPVLRVSAKTGLGVHKLLPALQQAIDAYHRRIPTRELNTLIQSAQAAHPSPGGRVLYATQGATDPPTFTLFTTKTLSPTYLRYLERRIREHFEFGPTPLKLPRPPPEWRMSWTHMIEALLVLTGAGCLISAAVWGRSSRRLHRAWKRTFDQIDEQGRGADAADLARSAFRKEVHTAGLYVALGVAALVLAGTAPRSGTLVVLTVLLPVLATFRYGPRFLAEARMAEQRAALVRRAEEVLSQEELAPKRWAARLAPTELPAIEGFEVGRVYEPGSGAMAGDFYDLYQTSPTRTAVVIGDVSGHGIEPSITAFQVKYLLRVFLREYRDPAQALEELNELMSAQGRPEDFVSLVAAVFDTAAGTLRYASAGHPPGWLWNDGEVKALRATGPLLTLDPKATYTSREVELDVGDLLLLYTDGLAEARDGEQLFGEERIASVLRRDPGQDANILCKSLLDAAHDFASGALTDDLAIVAIRRV